VVNEAGWTTGVEVFQDGQWQPAVYETITEAALEAEQAARFEVLEGVVVVYPEYVVDDDDHYEDYRLEREGLL
jgi:hypothetical protein